MAVKRTMGRVLSTAVCTAAILAGCGSRPASEPVRPTEIPPPAPASAPIPAPRPMEPRVAPAPAAAPRPVPAAEPPTQNTTIRIEARLTVAEAQRRLTELGYRPGGADGILGPRTAAALRQFQRDQGLRETGQIDADTSQRLRTAEKR